MKKEYSSPQLTVVNFRVEKGYTLSNGESAIITSFEFQDRETISNDNQASEFSYSDWSW